MKETKQSEQTTNGKTSRMYGDVRTIETRSSDGRTLSTQIRITMELSPAVIDSNAGSQIDAKFNKFWEEVESIL